MLMFLNLLICMFMYLGGIYVFASKRKHLLLMLLSLEFVVISLYLFIYFNLTFYDFEFFFLLVFLTFSVCEGVLGLSLLVSLIRSHGNDYFQILSIF